MLTGLHLPLTFIVTVSIMVSCVNTRCWWFGHINEFILRLSQLVLRWVTVNRWVCNSHRGRLSLLPSVGR